MDPWQIVAALAAALGATWGTFIASFFKGELIPGHVYRRELKRADIATTQAERNASSIVTIADVHREEREEHRRELAARDAEILSLRKQLAHAPPG